MNGRFSAKLSVWHPTIFSFPCRELKKAPLGAKPGFG